MSELHIRAELKKGGIYLYKGHKEILRIRKTLPATFANITQSKRARGRQSRNWRRFPELILRLLLVGFCWNWLACECNSSHWRPRRRHYRKQGREKGHNSSKEIQRCGGKQAVQEVVGAILFYGGTEGCVVTNSTLRQQPATWRRKTHSAYRWLSIRRGWRIVKQTVFRYRQTQLVTCPPCRSQKSSMRSCWQRFQNLHW